MNVADIYNSHGAEYPWGKGAMTRSVTLAAVLVVLSAVVARSAFCQSNRDLQTFFKQDIGPTKDEITAIRSGQPVAKTLPSRTPSEVFLFGAVYIHAAPQSYIRFVRDFDRRRELPSYWALQVFSNPPRLSDLKDFSFDNDEVQALRKCTPGDCQIQLPASSIEELQRSINWDAVDVNEQVNRLLQKTALQRLLAYQRKGNQALGVITISVTRPWCPSSSPICSRTPKPCQRTCRISIPTSFPIPTQSLQTSKTRSTGQE